ncbi:MAG TPA: VWA domain-containing protein [Thermoanaerobaculia bacterium]|nr:VWA domain-containing protein [Thermoanaerobaculia bacterium]
MRQLLLASALALSALPSFSQQTLVETIEVRVANIDVVVRDRSGHSISGLTKDDFELFDDGVPQKITNFYEVRRGEESSGDSGSSQEQVPLEVRQRRIVIFVDSASLTPTRKSAVLRSVEKFIDQKLRPEDRCMLVSWRFDTQVVTPFTNDRVALKRGLESIAHSGPFGSSSRTNLDLVKTQIQQLFNLAFDSQGDRIAVISFPDAYERSRDLVTRHGYALEAQERQLLGALDAVTTNMAGLDGKKVLVFVSETMPENPAADLYRFTNNLFGPYLNQNLVMDFETSLGVVGNDIPTEIDQMARDASANGVTIYTIGAAASDSDFSADSADTVDYTYTFARDANTSATLETVASMTGGVAITRTSNFDLAFDTIDRDLSSYYSLGYKPAGEGGDQHRITVKVKNPAYRVRSRRAFVVKSGDEQMADRVVANLYVDSTSNQWPVSIRMGKSKRDGRYFVVPVQIVIPPTLTLIPQGDNNLAGSFILYFAVGDASGRTSTVMRRPEDLKIPATSVATVRAKPMTFTTAFRIRGGESLLSVAIIDQLSGTMGFARAKIVAR